MFALVRISFWKHGKGLSFGISLHVEHITTEIESYKYKKLTIAVVDFYSLVAITYLPGIKINTCQSSLRLQSCQAVRICNLCYVKLSTNIS